MSKAQLPYSPTDFHQISQQPYPLPTDFGNVPDSGSGMSRAQLPYSTTNFYQIRQQPYPLQTDFENVPNSGSGMSRAQLPYSPTDFHQIRQQPYLLPTDFKYVPDSGSGMSRVEQIPPPNAIRIISVIINQNAFIPRRRLPTYAYFSSYKIKLSPKSRILVCITLAHVIK